MISYKITAQSPFKVFFSVLYSSVLYDRYTCVSTYNFPYIPIVTQTRWKHKRQILFPDVTVPQFLELCPKLQGFFGVPSRITINLGVPYFWTTHFSINFLVKSSPWRRKGRKGHGSCSRKRDWKMGPDASPRSVTSPVCTRMERPPVHSPGEKPPW